MPMLPVFIVLAVGALMTGGILFTLSRVVTRLGGVVVGPSAGTGVWAGQENPNRVALKKLNVAVMAAFVAHGVFVIGLIALVLVVGLGFVGQRLW